MTPPALVSTRQLAALIDSTPAAVCQLVRRGRGPAVYGG